MLKSNRCDEISFQSSFDTAAAVAAVVQGFDAGQSLQPAQVFS
jgi:hypothetical protein